MVIATFRLDISHTSTQLLECLSSNKHTTEKLRDVRRCLQRGADVNAEDRGGNTPLLLAVRREKAIVLRLLIKRGAKVNKWNTYFDTPLHVAVRYREKHIVDLLLKKGANVNARDLPDNSSLHIAASLARTSICDLLLNKDADLNAQDKFGDTPLHKAASSGDISVVHLLLDHGADVNVKAPDGYTPLHGAARSGNTSMVQLLLKKGAKVNQQTIFGYSHLHEAASSGEISTVQLLLDRGADVNEKTVDGFTALHGAAQSGQTSVAELLLNKGAKVNAQTIRGYTPLHGAVCSGAIPYVKIQLNKKSGRFERVTDAHLHLHDMACTFKTLIEEKLRSGTGTTENLPKHDRCSHLHDAQSINETSMVKLLLDKGANVNSQTRNGYTPLHVAACSGLTPVVELLLIKRAETKTQATNGDTPLYMAALSGKTSVVELLLNKGADANIIASNGDTPLNAAARFGNYSMVQLLLNRGAKVRTYTGFGLTPLHAAVSSRQTSVVKLLLNNGADVNKLTSFGESALLEAVRSKVTTLVEMLLNNGARVNVQTLNGSTPLYVAASLGNKSLVELLLNSGANVNMQRMDGDTALHAAVRSKETAIVELLLQNGASLNVKNTSGDMPIHEAAHFGGTSILKLLLRQRAIVDAENNLKHTPLHLAAISKVAAAVGLLISKGAPINAVDIIESTPLHEAVRCGEKSIVKQLLNYGADVNARAVDNYTALHYSAGSGSLHIAELLLKKSADVNAQTREGYTPLHMAMRSGLALVKLLLDKGADVNAKSMNGTTPLYMAVEFPVVELLLGNGADVNARDTSGYTALHGAVRRHYTVASIVELLLIKGANVNAQSTNGYTPLHEAAFYGKRYTVELLLKWGANVNTPAENAITPLHQAIKSSSIGKVKLLLNSGADINAQNSDGDTPLHMALRQENFVVATLLVRRSANVMLKNRTGDAPLSYAMLFSLKDNTDIARLLFTADKNNIQYSIQNYHSPSDHLSNNHLETFVSNGSANITENNSCHNYEQFKYLKINDKSGASGQLYETKMICLILLRMLNHEKLDTDFFLAANMDGIGEMDDICLRYQVKGLQRPIVLFMQVKHRESKEKITDEALWNDSSDFCLWNYFQTYLMIKERFQIGHQDPMFEGEFSDVKCYFVLYTTAKDIITKKKTDNEINEIMHDLLCTQISTVPFQYSYDEADVDRLCEVQTDTPVTRLDARDFLTSLWFYSNQFTQEQVKILAKDEISKYYNNENAGFIFEVHSSAIFLKAHDEVQKWWRLTAVAPYLSRSNDVFKAAKLGYLDDVFFGVINAMNRLKVNVDLEFKQHFNLRKVSDETLNSVHTIFTRLYKLFGANEQITVNAVLKENISIHFLIDDQFASIHSLPSSDKILSDIYESDDANDATKSFDMRKYEYSKRSGTSEFGGTLFRTKLLSLIKLRVQNHKQIKDYLIASRIRDIKVMNDICLRFQLKDKEKPVVLFMQLIHKEDVEKRQPTIEEVLCGSGSLSLPVLLASYMNIQNNFRINSSETIFKGDFRDVDCYFILYTPAKDKKSVKKSDHQVIKVFHDILNTNLNSDPYQYDYVDADLERLTKQIATDYVKKLGEVFLKSVKDDKYLPNLLENKLIARYHVAMGQEIIQQSEVQPAIENYRVWEFRPDFFKSDISYLVTLKKSFFKSFLTKRDLNKTPSELQQLAGEVQLKLLSLKMKLPLEFGNLDMTFRGNDEKVRKRIKATAGKLAYLMQLNNDTKVVEIDDNDVGPGKLIEQGIININGGIGSAVGNLLILDTGMKLLKLNLEHEELPRVAAMFLKELKTQYKPANNLGLIRFKINITDFPKCSFNENECDKIKVKEFISKLWFYPNQAKEDEVERILNYEINKKYTNQIDDNKQKLGKYSNLTTLHSINEMQNWWMQTSESPYLSRASGLFERAELAEICNLLQTVINYMYVLGIDRLDIKVKRYNVDDKPERIQQLFNKVSRNLFNLYDPQFNEPFDFKLEKDMPIFSSTSMFSLQIHPQMEWVALIRIAGSGANVYRVVAKASLCRGLHRAKDKFMIYEQNFHGSRCTTRDCFENVFL